MKDRFDYERFQCAIFDLDGTLINSTGVWEQVDVEFLGKRGIEVPPDFAKAIKTHNFVTGSEYVAKRFGLSESPEDIAAEWFEMAADAYANDIILKDGAKEFLLKLKQMGYSLAVATASDRALYEPCLKRNGIYDLFDNFTQSDEVKRGKGFPDVYELAADKCGYGAESCAVFEDVAEAVRGAVMGGFYTVAVSDEASRADERYIRENCNLFINDYYELL